MGQGVESTDNIAGSQTHWEEQEWGALHLRKQRGLPEASPSWILKFSGGRSVGPLILPIYSKEAGSVIMCLASTGEIKL